VGAVIKAWSLTGETKSAIGKVAQLIFVWLPAIISGTSADRQ